ncbi:CheR family methyltransferase [Usitatibacter palustris]|uniref:Chemotaxis protein methyltransferase n=1 Tax=Usitatibacter palustris TaxID=2732487 RepID=A0A6M4H781_9PROT|nr:CheR family methyltransferase [Usitatibacter palustris]QJR15035.1 Chemotaxis protein methyltransferase [Usitatibacter palustris]
MADTRIEAVAQDRGAGREFNFSLEHFKAISTRIYDFAGIRLTEAKREMVYARLARRLRSLGIDSFDNYIRYLELEPAEWEHCTNALTTNVTAFYREPHHFDILAKHAAEADAMQTYRVWSAGCSSGEEPYTIAMCLAESRPEGRFEVVASDLDTQVIAHGREGIYPLESVMALTAERQKRFFLRGTGRNSGHARVRRELASHVEFLRVNLMDDRWPALGEFDAIFCRNVMIYFDKATQRRLVERYAGLLRPNGLFFAGHAESLLDSGHRFRLRGQTVYELVRGAAA